MFINALARNNNMYHKNQQEDPLYAVARERKRKFQNIVNGVKNFKPFSWRRLKKIFWS